MQDVQESGEGVSGNLANLGLVHECLVEQIRSILFLAVTIFSTRRILAVLLGLLLGGYAWNIEAHLDQLVSCACRLLASELGPSKVPVRAGVTVSGKREVYSDLVLASQVGVGDLGIGHFKCWAVCDIEGELGLAKVGLAPVPAPQRMLAVVEIDAVPSLEHFGHAIKVVGLEAVELHYAVVP